MSADRPHRVVVRAEDGAQVLPRSLLDKVMRTTWWLGIERPRLEDLIVRIERVAHPRDHANTLPNVASFSEHLHLLADELLAHYVAMARWDRVTWTRIGELVGVTGQAAQQRFARARRTLVFVDADEFEARAGRPGDLP